MAQLKIRVGAVLDRSFDVVFANAEARGRRAAQAIGRSFNQELSKIGRGTPGGGTAGMGSGAGRDPALAGIQREERARIRAIRDAARLQHHEENLAHRQKLRNIEQEERQRLGGIRKARREQERANQVELREFARRTSHRATRFLTPNAPIGSMASRGLTDVVRGLGVDFSIAGSVSRSRELESRAVQVSNSGYLPNAGAGNANSQRVDPSKLVEDARAVTAKYGTDTMQALEALAGFAGIAGDLALGRSLLADMAKLSAATGTELGDMANAAANVANQLEDTPDKAARIEKVMRVIAGQGKLGAVEVSDLATQMARVASAASKFEGDSATNIEKMGALAQLARSTGGAPSAAEAARSVSGFATTLQKGKRIKAFSEAGVNVFADEGQTKFKDPIKLIEESLLATGGNLEKLNALFMDVVGSRAVGGLSKTFSEAGGGDAGIAAVRKEVARLTKGAQMTDVEIEESANRASSTRSAKAQKFQASLDRVTDEVMSELLPALEKVAPEFLKFAKVLGDVTTWTVENPKAAIGAAIALSIARAGLESMLRTSIERAVMGAGPSGSLPGGKNGGAFGTFASISTALTVASMVVTTAVIAKAVIDSLIDQNKADQQEAIDKNLTADEQLNRLTEKSAKAGGLSKEEYARVDEMSKDLAQRLAGAEVRQGSNETLQGMSDFLASALLGEGKNVAEAQVDATQIEALRSEMNQVLETLRRGIRITNLSDIPQAPGQPGSPGGVVAPPMPGP